ncbi:hypothetical protein C2E23DRAFT_114864 [Lenzites betulinus]|nr:hypothetical protein C2E23DRAFT_114864 [Lenzites betulinus]
MHNTPTWLDSSPPVPLRRELHRRRSRTRGVGPWYHLYHLGRPTCTPSGATCSLSWTSGALTPGASMPGARGNDRSDGRKRGRSRHTCERDRGLPEPTCTRPARRASIGEGPRRGGLAPFRGRPNGIISTSAFWRDFMDTPARSLAAQSAHPKLSISLDFMHIHKELFTRRWDLSRRSRNSVGCLVRVGDTRSSTTRASSKCGHSAQLRG